MLRVVVLGPGAAGKTTFARALGQATAVEVTELDEVFWSDGLEPLAPTAWRQRQHQLVAEPSWILDGDLGPYDDLEVRLARASDVVVFDPSPFLCAWRALRRGRRRWDFWVWLFTWRRRSRPRLLAAVDEHAPDARLHLIVSRSDREQTLAQLARQQR